MCYIPMLMEIGPQVPKDNFLRLYKTYGRHVTNISFPRTLKFTYKILSKKVKWFLLLALKFDLSVKYAKINP